jgi:Domain of unknown function DUF11
MSRVFSFVLFMLAEFLVTGPSVSTLVAADESRLEMDWFAGPWDIDYQAMVLPHDEGKLKTDQGAEFSDFVLSFSAQARFIVAKDRIVNRSTTEPGPSSKWEQIDEKGGRVIFHQRRPQFFHRAHWKTPGGEKSDYVFTSSGVFQGSGQFSAKALELNLEWTTLDGRGMSGGRRISKPVGAHAWKSKWTLQPDTPAKSDLAGVTTPKLILAATRVTPMPQQLAGCPPLPLLERVSIVRAPMTDLEVKAKDAADPVPASKTRSLAVSVKNLGPDDSFETVVRLLLPSGAIFISAGEVLPDRVEGEILTFHLDKLTKDASVKLDIRLEYPVAQKSEVKEAATTLVQVSGAGYDPNQGNNGHFVTAGLAAKPATKP